MNKDLENQKKRRALSSSSSSESYDSRGVLNFIRSGLSEIVDAGAKKISATLQKSKIQKSFTNEQISDKQKTESSLKSEAIVSSLSVNNIQLYQVEDDTNEDDYDFEYDLNHNINNLHQSHDTLKWEKSFLEEIEEEQGCLISDEQEIKVVESKLLNENIPDEKILDNNLFECSECNMSFKTKKGLKSHKTRKHTLRKEKKMSILQTKDEVIEDFKFLIFHKNYFKRLLENSLIIHRQEMNDKNNELCESKKNYNQKDLENEKSKNEIKMLKSKIDEIKKSDKNELNQKIAEIYLDYSWELKEKEKIIKVKDEELKRAQTEQDSIRTLLAQEKVALEQNVKKLEVEIQTSNRTIQTLTSNLNKTIADKDEEVKRVQSERDTSKYEFENLKATYENMLKIKLDDLAQEQARIISQKDKQIIDIDVTKGLLAQEKVALEQNVKKLEVEIQTSNRTIQTLTSNLNKTIADKDEEVKRVQSERDECKLKLRNYSDISNDSTVQLNFYQNEILNLSAKYNQVFSEGQKIFNEMSTVKADKDKIQDELSLERIKCNELLKVQQNLINNNQTYFASELNFTKNVFDSQSSTLMDYETSKNVFETSKSCVSNSEIPFDLFNLSKEQISNLKNLIVLDNESEANRSRKCNICNIEYSEYKYMRNHQTYKHFSILRSYRKVYGSFFERYLEKF
ncbi:unnamed protein product [Brachionus calyciflorus]|uniref:C2H2-type domain-containing protein n=1 Tax=Brachionus calyciflorus TaxID=104777 RepID=A0A814HRW2_9BILA|nr:unnamed protein product [Brachionus calyciflorus]